MRKPALTATRAGPIKRLPGRNVKRSSVCKVTGLTALASLQFPPAVANPRAYRALVKQPGGPVGSSTLHLIRDDAEASLCGIPRISLGAAGGMDDVVCADCLTWFERRRAVSGAFPTIAPHK